MNAPRRIQLRRAKGWRRPDGAVVVARSTRWGNPLVVGGPDSADPGWPLPRERAVDLFRLALEQPGALAHLPVLPFTVDDVREHLAGRDLACWCPAGGPCHADVLLDLANPAPTQET